MQAADRVLSKPFVLVVLAEFGVCLAIGMLLVVLPVYAKGPLNAGSVGVGIAVAAVSPALLVFQPIAGRIGDRRGRRLLVTVGALVSAGSIAAYTAAESLELLVGLRLVSGIGEALILVGGATMVTDLAPESRRGEAVSLYTLGLWGGFALGPLFGEAILGDNRYDAVWLTAAACCAVAAIIGLALPETRPTATDHDLVSRFIHPAAIRPGAVLIALLFAFAGFGAFVALYARELGLDGAGAVFLVFSVGVAATRIVARRVPDRLGAKRTSGGALVVVSAGLLTIGVWNTSLGLFAGTLVFAVGHAFAFPALMTLAVNRAPAAERSSVVGTFSACAEIGFAAGAISLGAVAAVAGYASVFVVCSAAPLLGTLVLARTPAPMPTAAVDNVVGSLDGAA
jgi:MFS family permease